MTWAPEQNKINLDPPRDAVVGDAMDNSSYSSLKDRLSLENIPLTSSGQNGVQTVPMSPLPKSTHVVEVEGIALNRAFRLFCSPLFTLHELPFLRPDYPHSLLQVPTEAVPDPEASWLPVENMHILYPTEDCAGGPCPDFGHSASWIYVTCQMPFPALHFKKETNKNLLGVHTVVSPQFKDGTLRLQKMKSPAQEGKAHCDGSTV